MYMKFYSYKLDNKPATKEMLQMTNLYHSVINGYQFTNDDFLCLFSNSLPLCCIRNENVLPCLYLDDDKWVINDYVSSNNKELKNKLLPPFNLAGFMCIKKSDNKKIINSLLSSILSTLNITNAEINEFGEVYIKGKKILSLDSFTNIRNGEEVNSVSFFLILSSIDKYKEEVIKMARKSVYGSVFDYEVTPEFLEDLKNRIISNFKEKLK